MVRLARSDWTSRVSIQLLTYLHIIVGNVRCQEMQTNYYEIISVIEININVFVSNRIALQILSTTVVKAYLVLTSRCSVCVCSVS